MSFFGFEQSDLEQEKLNLKNGSLQHPGDVAVYTWGEEGYDGLGDLLQEGGDELNDETFGAVGNVGLDIFLTVNEISAQPPFLGKDFDFSSPALPDAPRPLKDAETHVKGHILQTKQRASSPEPSQPCTVL